MILNNLQIGLRCLQKRGYYSILNILGFSFALCAVILIGLYAHREFSTNMFHKDADRIYKVSGWGCPYALAGTIKDGVPEIGSITNLQMMSFDEDETNVMLQTEDGAKEIKLGRDGLIATDSSFFDVFTFPLIMGNQDNPFPDYQSCIITRSVAEALFGDEDPMGEIIKIEGDPRIYTISGVTEDVPLNSSLRYSVIVPMDPRMEIGGGMTLAQDWRSYMFEIFAKIPHSVENIDSLQSKIQRIVKQNGNLQYEVDYLILYSLKDVYFDFAKLNGKLKGGNYGQVMAMVWVGIIILLLAIVNFFNLSTASGMIRSKEIGLRKVHGGTRSNLITQFLSESVLIAFFAMIIALMMVNVIIPKFEGFVGASYDHIYMTELWQWILLIGGSVIVGTIAGSYPAFYLSAVDPINALYAGRVRTGFGVVMFRKALIVFQLVASTTIIICTFIISGQLNHMRTQNLGFDKDVILTVVMDEVILSQKQAFISKISSIPAVESLSITPYYLGDVNMGNKLKGEYRGEEIELSSIRTLYIDTAFFSTFGIEIVEGRNPYSHEIGSSILNEAAVAALGLDSPLEFKSDAGHRNPDGISMNFYNVVGVCKNFNFKPLKTGIEPLIIYLTDMQYMQSGIINLRLNAHSLNDFSQIHQQIEEIHESFNPKEPLEMKFLNTYLDEVYSEEEKFKEIFSVFSGIAILISCTGLFGLIIISNARRRKEIGVRRVHGATIIQILRLLIQDYMVYVAISFVVSVPTAWYFMTGWLESYPYKVGMHWWYFALAGMIVLVIVALTVGLQSWRTATMNPVKSLKSE